MNIIPDSNGYYQQIEDLIKYVFVIDYEVVLAQQGKAVATNYVNLCFEILHFLTTIASDPRGGKFLLDN